MRTRRDQEERMYTPLISISNAEIKGGGGELHWSVSIMLKTTEV